MNAITDLFKKPEIKQPTPSDYYSKVHQIPLERIIPNRSQPRRKFDDESIIRLADSIRKYGVLQPISVRIIDGDNTYNSLYEIIAGERRFRAAKLLGLAGIPCLIIKADDRRSAELAIIENIQREDLNMFEQAAAIAALIDLYNLTQEQVAVQLSASQSFIANKLRLLRLGTSEREKILAHSLTERHARALLRIPSAEQRIKAIDYICSHCLNVATTEEYVDKLLSETKTQPKRSNPRKIVLKDIRVFYNTVERAIDIVKQAGVGVVSEKHEEENATRIIITIPREPLVN